jgi:L-iditol 2-dehydrogenase
MGTPIQTLPVSAAAFKEVDLKGVWRYANTYPEAMQLLQASRTGSRVPDVSKLITHTFCGLESVQDAFATAGQTKDSRGDLVIKVVVQI